jgi:hypothetical protein
VPVLHFIGRDAKTGRRLSLKSIWEDFERITCLTLSKDELMATITQGEHLVTRKVKIAPTFIATP